MLASAIELAARIKGGIQESDTDRAEACLEDASNLALAVGEADWTDQTVPDVVKTIVIAAAKRAFLNPAGVRSESIDGYAQTFGSGDVYLTKGERRDVRKAADRSGAGSVTLGTDLPMSPHMLGTGDGTGEEIQQ